MVKLTRKRRAKQYTSILNDEKKNAMNELDNQLSGLKTNIATMKSRKRKMKKNNEIKHLESKVEELEREKISIQNNTKNNRKVGFEKNEIIEFDSNSPVNDIVTKKKKSKTKTRKRQIKTNKTK